MGHTRPLLFFNAPLSYKVLNLYGTHNDLSPLTSPASQGQLLVGRVGFINHDILYSAEYTIAISDIRAQ